MPIPNYPVGRQGGELGPGSPSQGNASPGELVPVEGEFAMPGYVDNNGKDRFGVRYRCGLAVLATVERLEDGTVQEGWARLVGRRGIGLDLPAPVEPGAPVLVRPRADWRKERFLLRAEVVRATPVQDGSGRIDCAFIRPIAADNLDALLD